MEKTFKQFDVKRLVNLRQFDIHKAFDEIGIRNYLKVVIKLFYLDNFGVS